ncbi:hypothetical protein [Macrococcus equipercicus]|uniref:Rho termination factor N-terminal domain-containing protein n=1 Tax=Macrococcus equipercicus TaxID=69967 RepID=A0A9Q9BTC0_9STAP|nr:hypothetical protein [Macrococcus equipercicus]UTH13626.1 hypothetical protein KFV11_10445 [Macrococcus equipercicus]
MFDKELDLTAMDIEQIRKFERPLAYYLTKQKNDSLKEICRFFGIKGYSGKNKEALVALINDFVFKDNAAADKMFDDMAVEEYNVLNHLLISDHYAEAFDAELAPHHLIFSGSGYAFMPSDVKEYLRAYVVERSGTEGQDDEVKALVSAVNLYGYFSLDHYAAVLKKYLNIEMTAADLERELAGVATLKDGFVLNPLMSESMFSGQGVDTERTYYMPDTWDEFQQYFAFEYHPETRELTTLLDHLEQYLTTPLRRKDLIDSVIVMMKMMDHPKHLMNIITDLEQEGILASVPQQPTELYLIAAFRTVRNWHLGGHQMLEIAAAEGSRRTAPMRVINKQVKKKSKKRRKNMNVSRFRK